MGNYALDKPKPQGGKEFPYPLEMFSRRMGTVHVPQRYSHEHHHLLFRLKPL